MKSFKKEYSLSLAGINDCCEDIRSFANSAGMSSQDTVKLVFSAEEALLRYRNHYNDDPVKIKADISRRFGRLRLNIYIPGEAYNALVVPDDTYQELSGIFDDYILSLSHTYKNGINCISCEKTVNTDTHFFRQLIVAIVIGVAVGFLSLLLPQAFNEPFDELLNTVNGTLMGLIKMSALPVIFLCTICGICDCGGISTFGKTAKKTLFGYFGTIFFMLLGSFFVSILFLRFRFSVLSGESGSFASTLSVLFSVFPDNIISPFNNGDNIKVLFIGVMTGCALLTIGKKGEEIVKTVRNMSAVSNTIMEWMCKPIPVIIAILIIQSIRDPSMFRDAANAWQPIAVVLIVYTVTVILDIYIVSKKKGLGFSFILKCVFPLFIKGTATASTVLTYPDLEKTLTEKFKVKQKTVNFSLPLGVTFFQPTTILLSAVTLYFAYISGIELSVTWIISFILLCFVAGMAIPPVTGGVVAMLSLMFSSLGISDAYLILGSSLLMIIDFPNTGGRVALIALEIARLSGKGEKRK